MTDSDQGDIREAVREAAGEMGERRFRKFFSDVLVALGLAKPIPRWTRVRIALLRLIARGDAVILNAAILHNQPDNLWKFGPRYKNRNCLVVNVRPVADAQDPNEMPTT